MLFTGNQRALCGSSIIQISYSIAVMTLTSCCTFVSMLNPYGLIHVSWCCSLPEVEHTVHLTGIPEVQHTFHLTGISEGKSLARSYCTNHDHDNNWISACTCTFHFVLFFFRIHACLLYWYSLQQVSFKVDFSLIETLASHKHYPSSVAFLHWLYQYHRCALCWPYLSVFELLFLKKTFCACQSVFHVGYSPLA